jgi:3-oxoacyl-[acyl-carrier-protein] synthase-3
MQRKYGEITGWGKYVPEKVLTNHDLEQIMETNDEWIVQRTGIRRRHVAAEHETTASMSVHAARAAMKKAGITANDLDLIILATTSVDHLTPPTSSIVQDLLGAKGVPAFVLNTGCTGFVYALNTAHQFIQTGAYGTILVIGAELLTRFMNWNDRNTAVLFGDAAGAVVIEATEKKCGVLGFDMGSDGSGAEYLMVPAMGAAEPLTENTFHDGRQYLQMNGREVFKFASRVLGRTSAASLRMARLALDDVDMIIPHQANLRIIQAAARDIGLPLEKFIITVDEYANTSAASIPVALVDGLEVGRIKPTDKLLLVSFGAGLTWASSVLQMAPATEPAVYQNGHSVKRARQGALSVVAL